MVGEVEQPAQQREPAAGDDGGEAQQRDQHGDHRGRREHDQRHGPGRAPAVPGTAHGTHEERERRDHHGVALAARERDQQRDHGQRAGERHVRPDGDVEQRDQHDPISPPQSTRENGRGRGRSRRRRACCANPMRFRHVTGAYACGPGLPCHAWQPRSQNVRLARSPRPPASANGELPSFGKELFLGNFRLDLIHPQPRLDPAAVEKGEALPRAAARASSRRGRPARDRARGKHPRAT